MRVVLDTNVVLSTLLFSRGHLCWIRDAWRARQFTLFISKATTQELIRVLSYPKFKLSSSDIEALLGDYLPYCETVTDMNTDDTLPDCRDPHDQKFLELALAADADILVTGDQALLELDAGTGFTIETPARFKQRFP